MVSVFVSFEPNLKTQRAAQRYLATAFRRCDQPELRPFARIHLGPDRQGRHHCERARVALPLIELC